MPRRRWIIAVAVLIALLAAVEIGARRWERPKVGVVVVNEAEEVMEDLVISYAGTRVPLGRVVKGHSVQIRLTAGPPGSLRIDFRQKGNGIQGFEIPDFHPDELLKDNYKQVVVVRTNNILRSLDDDEARTEKAFGEVIYEWFRSQVMSPR